ncbi:MAG: secretin N-terminal domain-containing protein [Candidatus Aminicenantia bacterium]
MKKLVILLPLIVLWSCATISVNFDNGERELLNGNYEKAVSYFEKAVRENPKNPLYRVALMRAKYEGALHHLGKARKFRNEEKKEEALKEYKIALSFDPTNTALMTEMESYQKEESKKEAPPKKYEYPVKLSVTDEKIKMKFQNSSLRSIFQGIGKFYGINILFDPQFQDTVLSIDLEDMNLEQALSSVCSITRNFWTVINPKTVVIVPDTLIKRRQYEIQAIRTFYLKYADAEQLRQILATVGRTPRIAIDKASNSITVKGTSYDLQAIEDVIEKIDKPGGEVILDVEIMEVNRTKLLQYGIDLSPYAISTRLNPKKFEEGLISWPDLKSLPSEDIFLSIPTPLINFLHSDSSTRIIAQPRLRGVDSKKINFNIGEKIPVPITTFTPIAAGGIAQQPVTSFEYKDVGIGVEITPKIHSKDEVSLELKLAITSLSGYGYANLPILGNRLIENVIRLKHGETTLLAGLLRDDERKALRGIAGLKNIPLIGDLFSADERTISQTDIILTITPHIIKSLPIDEKDLEPLWTGPEEGGLMPGILPAEREIEERTAIEIAPESPSSENTLSIVPSSIFSPPNSEIAFEVFISSSTEISSLSFQIRFDPSVVRAKDVNPGGSVISGAKPPSFLKDINNGAGVITIGLTSVEPSKGIIKTGTLLNVSFQVLKEGSCDILIEGIGATDVKGRPVQFSASSTFVKIGRD